MKETLYIIKDEDGYRLGAEPVVRLWEPEWISRTWIRKVTVDLPEGFQTGINHYGEPMIFRGEEHYEIGTDGKENPVIIDHKNNGAYIHLPILTEGWNEA